MSERMTQEQADTIIERLDSILRNSSSVSPARRSILILIRDVYEWGVAAGKQEPDWTCILDADGREIEGVEIPEGTHLVSYLYNGVGYCWSAYHDRDRGWLNDNNDPFGHSIYAWKPWPDPAPRPGEKS